MKQKLFLIGYFILWKAAIPLLWAAPDFFQKSTTYFSYDDLFIAGEKVNLSFADINCSTNFSSYNYGISVFSDNYLKKLPCTFQAGTILIGGIISRLNNPFLDGDASGYGNCFTAPAIITSQLPSFTSYSKPFSTFLQLGYDNEEKIISRFKINGSYTPSPYLVNFSTLAEINIGQMFSITETSGISMHYIEENRPNTWYSTIPYYESRKTFSFGNQLAININDIFRSNFSIFIYDSPLGKFGAIYKIENKFLWKKIELGLAGLLNCNQFLITPENNILKPIAEIKSNLKYDFNIFKTGFTFLGKYPLTPPTPPTLKFGIAATLTSPITTVYGNSSFTFIYDSQLILTYCSTKLESTWITGEFSHKINLSSQFYFSSVPKSEKIIPKPTLNTQCHSISWIASFLDDTLNSNTTFSFSCRKGDFYNKKLNLGLTFNGNLKKLIIILKINGEFCI